MYRQGSPTGVRVNPSCDGRTGNKAGLLGRAMRVWEMGAQLRLAGWTQELRARRGSLKRAAHPLRAMAGRAVNPRCGQFLRRPLPPGEQIDSYHDHRSTNDQYKPLFPPEARMTPQAQRISEQ